MSCREWEESVAAGDPPAEGHLAECAECRGLREALAILREAHAEEIAPAHYAAVRARVLAELRPRRRWSWAWAGVAVAAAVVLGVGVGIERRMRVAELPRVASRAPEVVEAARPLTDARGPVRERVAAKPKRRPEEILVKIETEDVVIYWIAEAKGDE